MSKSFAFVGAPGSGKTTLTAETFTYLKQAGLNVELVPEMIRSDIHANGPNKSVWEQYRTLLNQREREDAVPTVVDIVLADSGTISSYFYTTLYADHSDARQRLVMQDFYRYLLDDLYRRRYHGIFYLPFPPGNKNKLADGTRFQTAEENDRLDQHMKMIFTSIHNPGNVHCIDGPLDERLQKVMSIILEKDI